MWLVWSNKARLVLVLPWDDLQFTCRDRSRWWRWEKTERTWMSSLWDWLSLIIELPVVPPLFPAVRNSGDREEVEGKHQVPAEHRPLPVIQSQGFLQGIFQLNILERFLILLWGQHNLGSSIRTYSGLHLFLLLRGFESTFWYWYSTL